jgi:hypothetical protein
VLSRLRGARTVGPHAAEATTTTAISPRTPSA